MVQCTSLNTEQSLIHPRKIQRLINSENLYIIESSLKSCSIQSAYTCAANYVVVASHSKIATICCFLPETGNSMNKLWNYEKARKKFKIRRITVLKQRKTKTNMQRCFISCCLARECNKLKSIICKDCRLSLHYHNNSMIFHQLHFKCQSCNNFA